MQNKLIAILTDFGNADPYTGIMKGVLAEITPNATWIDITHQIPPGDIQRGAFVLWQAARDFPAGTIFLCVVDPGVGTQRKAVYLQTKDQIFIGPDNGLFSYLIGQDDYPAWELTNPTFQREGKSQTFDGRDLFAPAAAYAALGIPGDQFGPQINPLVRLPDPVLEIQSNGLRGEVLSEDHYGNLFTSIGRFKRVTTGIHFSSWLGNESVTIPNNAAIQIKIREQSLPLSTTFAKIPDGKAAGVIGSTGLLEIAANQRSARELLSLEIADPVKLEWKTP